MILIKLLILATSCYLFQFLLHKNRKGSLALATLETPKEVTNNWKPNLFAMSSYLIRAFCAASSSCVCLRLATNGDSVCFSFGLSVTRSLYVCRQFLFYLKHIFKDQICLKLGCCLFTESGRENSYGLIYPTQLLGISVVLEDATGAVNCSVYESLGSISGGCIYQGLLARSPAT